MQGNHHCNRIYYACNGSIGEGYHYSNSDGYYYSNPDGSTYFNDCKGYARYTRPDGTIVETIATDLDQNSPVASQTSSTFSWLMGAFTPSASTLEGSEAEATTSAQ